MLQDSEFGYCVDDAVIFRVELTVFGDLQVSSSCFTGATSEGQCSEMPSRENALDVCLSKLLNGNGSDVTIIAGSTSPEKLSAHKCILMARSPVFSAMFTYTMAESASSTVTMPDFEPPVVREMLHFMYTDTCSSSDIYAEHGVALLCMALKYQVLGMVGQCEAYFCSQLSEETAVSLLMLADTYSATGLKQKTLQFIAHHPAVATSPEYRDLDADLLKEASGAIEAVSKRRGLHARITGSSSSSDKTGSTRSVSGKLANACTIM